MKIKMALTAAVCAAMFASSAQAEVIINADGTGFIGKGDVQLALGMNNAQLQAATLVFAVSTVTGATWTCDRDAGPQTQERTNTTTTQGVLSTTARVRNQITGFILNGYSAGGVTVETDGPAIGSCPTFWTAIDLVVSDPVASGVTVNGVPLQ